MTGSREAFVRVFVGGFAVYCMLGAACGPAHEGSGSAPDAGGEASGADAAVPPALCATDPRAQSFTAGMEQAGSTGIFRVRLLEMAPAPAFKGDNVWTAQIVDATGIPLDGATLTVKPFMPDHGHGSSITPLVIPVGRDGRYTITHLNLFMPGIWRITLAVSGVGSARDSAVFTFCVAG